MLIRPGFLWPHTLVPLALGTSGYKILEDALQDLVNAFDESPDPSTTRSSTWATIWSRVAYVSGALISILWVAPVAVDRVHSSWKSSFFICIITMTIAVIISGIGHIVYHQECLQKNILGCLKIFSRQDTSPKNLDQAKREITLDMDIIRKEETGNSCYKQEYKVVLKSLLKMLSMSLVFSVVGIISATGSTLFLQQFYNLHTNNDTVVQIYILVQTFSKFAIPFAYSRIPCLAKNEKFEIGVGMLCGVISCTLASHLEVYKVVSFLWYIPQFFMLGCMDGLTQEGILKFYKSRITEQLPRYQEEYIEFWMGIGKLLNIIFILILPERFEEMIDDSQLYKYFVFLVCVGLADFMIYCCIAMLLYKVDQELDKDDEDLANDELQEDHSIEQISDIEQNQVMAEDDRKQDNNVTNNDDLGQIITVSNLVTLNKTKTWLMMIKNKIIRSSLMMICSMSKERSSVY